MPHLNILPDIIIEVFKSLIFQLSIIHSQEVLNVILVTEVIFVDQLMVKNINPYGDTSATVGELQSVGQKVKEHLQVPPLIPNNGLDQVKVDALVDNGL